MRGDNRGREGMRNTNYHKLSERDRRRFDNANGRGVLETKYSGPPDIMAWGGLSDKMRIRREKRLVIGELTRVIEYEVYRMWELEYETREREIQQMQSFPYEKAAD